MYTSRYISKTSHLHVDGEKIYNNSEKRDLQRSWSIFFKSLILLYEDIKIRFADICWCRQLIQPMQNTSANFHL